MKAQFSAVDWVVFGLMLTASLGVGVYSCVKGGGRSTQEYLVGSRKMAPLPVAFSLVGGVISAISILGEFFSIIWLFVPDVPYISMGVQ